MHYVVPGGGLSADGSRWLPSRADFLVPVKALSIVFRAKFRDILRREGLLETGRPGGVVARLGGALAGRRRRPASLRYLAPYVFRVAIGDHRIVSCDDGQVTFTYRRVGSNRPRKMTLDAMEFLRRFLQHVLPAGFQKVRHYGFLSPNSGTSIEAVRWLITLHNGAVFTLAGRCRPRRPPGRPRRGARRAAARCPSWDSCRPWRRRSSTRASPMACSRVTSPRRSLTPWRCRGPVAVRAVIRFECVGGHSRSDLAAENPLTTPRRAAPRIHAWSRQVHSPARLSLRSRLPPRSVSHIQSPAVPPPGFLNTDWRSGFADSNPYG